MRVDFESPKGDKHHATLIDPDDMTHGQKMRVQELMSLYNDDTMHMFHAGAKILEKLIAVAVTDWSLDLPLPKGDPTLLEDVPSWAYDELAEGVEEHRNRLDFIRALSISSASRTPSEDSSSQDKSPQTQP